MKVYIEKISSYDYDKILNFVEKLFIDTNMDEILKNKSTILLKPNLLGPHEPEKAITTHPLIIEAVVEILHRMGKEVWIGDSPGGVVSPTLVFQKTGMCNIILKYNLQLMDFSKEGIEEVKNSKTSFNIAKPFLEADAVINICKYKTHSLMLFTGAVKNLYGIIPGLKKSDYHRQFPGTIQFGEVISDLYSLVNEKICLNIMDGILGMEGEGPSSGKVRNFGVLFGSVSASALDLIASSMMGFSPDEIPYLAEALKSDKLLKSDIEVEEEWKNYVFENVDIKSVKRSSNLMQHFPPFLKDIFKYFFNYYPDFKKGCRKCNICVNSCPVNAMTLKAGMLHPKIDYSKCIKCMCCHEFCPFEVVYIKKKLFAKILLK